MVMEDWYNFIMREVLSIIRVNEKIDMHMVLGLSCRDYFLLTMQCCDSVVKLTFRGPKLYYAFIDQNIPKS